ncbi:MAG TPA: hypothetical protein PLB49_15580 [Chitinophagaceae bacterium]|nr:hypothetical protein [Chitinophagaceae bacterium]
MGKQKNTIVRGTFNNATWYVMNGIGYVRSKSKLTGKRVKKSPAFKKTMDFARKLGEASSLASELYQTVPANQKSIRLFRLITGMVITGFKKGNTEEEVKKEVGRTIPALVKQVKKER